MPTGPDVAAADAAAPGGFRLFVHLPPEVYEALCARAAMEEATLASVTRQALQAHLGLVGRSA